MSIVSAFFLPMCLKTWPTASYRRTPQVLPVLHAPDEAALPSEIELPLSREAKLEIFLRTCGLPHSGQTTSSTALLLRTSSSKDSEQSLHSNSKMGMKLSWFIQFFNCGIILQTNF
jgi:hypothetical protein